MTTAWHPLASACALRSPGIRHTLGGVTSPAPSADARFFLWALPGWYWVCWFACASALFSTRYLAHAFALATVYAGFHAYEARFRGRCALSSDSTAAPAAFVTLAASLLFHRARAGWEFDEFQVALAWFGVAFMAGHAGAFGLAWLGDTRSGPPVSQGKRREK